jgi:DNA modification methylase
MTPTGRSLHRRNPRRPQSLPECRRSLLERLNHFDIGVFSRAERDRWFSQVWDDIRGTRQAGGRGRTGAFPQALADRIVRMFSIVGDTVLDPFAGTGTTLWAAAELGRDAIGVEWDGPTYHQLRQNAVAHGILPPPE